MTRPDLAASIKALSLQMAEVSAEMEYYGGFDEEYKAKAAELANAAAIAWSWHEAILAEMEK